jgi:chromosomal replication initiation ATPase DnaA
LFYKSKLKKCIEVAQPYFENEITIERLQNRRRTKDYVLPRFFVMGLLDKSSQYSRRQIANMLNMKDHTSILHGCNRAYEIWGDELFEELQTND